MARARVGLISDTHGLLRPEALAFLQGANQIIHAGDIGDGELLDRLAAIAPVTVVRGNNDTESWAEHIPLTQRLVVADVHILVVHDLKTLSAVPLQVRVVVSGHSHKPLIERRGDVLFVNPGSAGRRRFKLPIAVGELIIDAGQIEPRIHELE